RGESLPLIFDAAAELVAHLGGGFHVLIREVAKGNEGAAGTGHREAVRGGKRGESRHQKGTSEQVHRQLAHPISLVRTLLSRPRSRDGCRPGEACSESAGEVRRGSAAVSIGPRNNEPGRGDRPGP